MVEGVLPSTMTSVQRQAKIKKLLASMSLAELARVNNVSRTTIRRWLDPSLAHKDRMREKEKELAKKNGGFGLPYQIRGDINKNGHPYTWTAAVIVKKMHEWEKKYGVPPTSTDWFKRVKFEDGHRIWPPTGEVQAVFGSWNRGLLAAGFPARQSRTKPVPPVRLWSKEQIIELMQEWVKENRIPPTQNEWDDSPDHPSPTTVGKIFGSWNEAVKEAGFTPRPTGITKKAILNYLPLPRNR